MVKKIYGYKWSTLKEANSAKTALKQHFGLPIAPEHTTTEYASVSTGLDEANKTIYYIVNDEQMSKVLGAASYFNILEPGITTRAK